MTLDIKLSETKDDDDDDDDEQEDMDVGNQQPSSSRKGAISHGDEAVDVPRKKPKTVSPKPSPSKPSPAKPSPSKAKAPATSSPTKVGKKPMCKYGVKCYQKSRQHKHQFAHPQVL